jgi:hypothetical protein
MRFNQRIGMFVLLCSSSLLSQPVFSADAIPDKGIAYPADFRTRVSDYAFQSDLCLGSSDGKPGVAKIMVAGMNQLRAEKGNELATVDTFRIVKVIDGHSALAAILAAEGIAALSKAGQRDNSFSLGAAEVFCLAALKNYESYLKKNHDVAATELEMVGVAGAAFEQIFVLIARAEDSSFPSRDHTSP